MHEVLPESLVVCQVVVHVAINMVLKVAAPLSPSKSPAAFGEHVGVVASLGFDPESHPVTKVRPEFVIFIEPSMPGSHYNFFYSF